MKPISRGFVFVCGLGALAFLVACESDGGGAGGIPAGPWSVSHTEGGASGGGGGGQSPAAVAQTFCGKLVQCGMPAEYESDCREGVQEAFQYMVNAADVASCLNRQSCDDLENDTEWVIQQCVDLDWDSFACDDLNLRYCTNAGECTTVDCQQACDTFHPEADRVECDYDEDDGHDKCLCIETVVIRG